MADEKELDLEVEADVAETPEEIADDDLEGSPAEEVPEDEAEAEEAGSEADEPRPGRRGVPDAGQAEARKTREARLRRENDDLQRRLREAGAPRPDPAQAQREYEAQQQRELEAAQERERLGDVGAVARHLYERGNRESAQRTQFYANQQFEREDRSEFRILCRENPTLATVSDEVERLIADARAQGNFQLTREAVAKHQLGERLLKRASHSRGAQRRAGADKIERERVRAPANAASAETRPSRRPREADWTAEDYERYAGNVPIR